MKDLYNKYELELMQNIQRLQYEVKRVENTGYLLMTERLNDHNGINEKSDMKAEEMNAKVVNLLKKIKDI